MQARGRWHIPHNALANIRDNSTELCIDVHAHALYENIHSVKPPAPRGVRMCKVDTAVARRVRDGSRIRV